MTVFVVAIAAGDSLKYQSFVYISFVWETHVRYNTMFYYMPSTFYKVKLPIALGNIFHWTESILAHSHDDAKIHIRSSIGVLALPHSDDVKKL